MLLRDIEMISTTRLHRENSVKRRVLQFLENIDGFRLAVAGSGIVAVISCIILLTAHHNAQMASIQNKMRGSEIEWERRTTEMEMREKRDVAEFQQWKENQERIVAKRSVSEDTPRTPVGGVVYTRWGRHDCPEFGPSRLIYHGITAGSLYGHTGGGAAYMCIHANVSYEDGRFTNGFNGASHVYGVEWRDSTWINNLYEMDDVMDGTVQYHSVPCAVCLAERRSGKVMIPGRSQCPQHWITEYDGFVMASGHSDKHSTEFICVDKRPQVIPGTQGSQGGGSIQMVETQCASLQCEPVVSGRELRCVVCTI